MTQQNRYIVGILRSDIIDSVSQHAVLKFIQYKVKSWKEECIELKTLKEAKEWCEILNCKDGTHKFIYDKVADKVITFQRI